MKLFFSGGAALTATLLATSVLFYAKPLFAETSASQQPTSIQQQEKESARAEALQADTRPASEAPSVLPAGALAATLERTEAAPASASTVTTAEAPIAAAVAITMPQAYVATAYSLPGRTASGMRVAKGVIAADPRVLPLGTRVRLEAGPYSGEYVVADTGSAVRGRKIDVWVPSYREACRFGRRQIKLSVLSYGGRRAKARRQK
jgi:3D (Asp-Asp-Asp) domain-containing protein